MACTHYMLMNQDDVLGLAKSVHVLLQLSCPRGQDMVLQDMVLQDMVTSTHHGVAGHGPRKTKIAQLDCPIGADEDVLGLHISADQFGQRQELDAQCLDSASLNSVRMTRGTTCVRNFMST
eukprot:1156608-Pelagomonas_calceolata.AAC.8